MRSVSTLFRNVDEMEAKLTKPKWDIGFLYFPLDEKDMVDIDALHLMKHFGFDHAYELCNSFYCKHKGSIAMPVHDDIDLFFEHLRQVGLYEKTDNASLLKQTPEAEEIYEKIIMHGFCPEVDWTMQVPQHTLPTI